MVTMFNPFDVSRLTKRFGVELTGVGAAELLGDRAHGALERWGALAEGDRDTAEAAESAWDLLACWGGLRRMLPALRDGGALRWATAEVERVVAAEGPTLAALVLESLPDLARWVDFAEAYAEETDDPTLDPEERARAARELLADLDDAAVVAWALDRLAPGSSEEWADALQGAVARVAEDPGAWFAAWMWIADLRVSFDPLLVEHDPDLAFTQDTFASVLDALEEVEGPWSDEEPRITRVARVIPICRPHSGLMAANRGAQLDPTTGAETELVLDGGFRVAWCEVVFHGGEWRPARPDDAQRFESAVAVSINAIMGDDGEAAVVPPLELRAAGETLVPVPIAVAPTQVVLVAAWPTGPLEVLVGGRCVWVLSTGE